MNDDVAPGRELDADAVTLGEVLGLGDEFDYTFDPDVADRLRRYTRLNRNAPELYAGMTGQGYEFHGPERSADGELRATYRGSRHLFSLYLNSRSLRCLGVKAREYAATLPGAETIVDGVAFPYGGPAGIADTLRVTAEMVRWADGETEAE